MLTLAKQAKREQQWQRMKTLMDQAIALKPKAPEVIYLQFLAYLHTSYFEQAFEMAEKLKVSAYYGAEELDMLMEVAATKTEEKDKIFWLNNALKVMPTFVPAMVQMFQIAPNEKQVYKWAESCPNVQVLTLMHSFWQELEPKKYLAKIEGLSTRIGKQNPKYESYSKAYLLQLAKQYDAAAEHYQQASVDLPHSRLYRDLAELQTHVSTGGNRRSKWLEKALEAKPFMLIGEETLDAFSQFKEKYPTLDTPKQVPHVQ